MQKKIRRTVLIIKFWVKVKATLKQNVKEAARMATPEHKSAEENNVMSDAH